MSHIAARLNRYIHIGRICNGLYGVLMPLAEMFCGERYAIVRDPFGHYWALCTRRELLAPDEVAARDPAGTSEGGWTGS